MKRLFVLVLFTVLLVSPLQASSTANLEEARETMAALVAALNAMDAGAMARYFTPDVSIFGPPDDSLTVGFSREEYAVRFRAGLRYELVLANLDLRPAGDSVVATGSLNGTIYLPGATTSQTGPWRFTAVLVNDGTAWRIAHLHVSPLFHLRYYLQLPKDYTDKPALKRPLILFLHGSGERGDNLEFVTRHGVPPYAATAKDFPFIVVSPQCPAGTSWVEKLGALNLLLDEVVAKYAVDEDRIYLTGLSMGGYGTWYMAMAYPTRFAAIVPICGGGDPSRAAVLKDMPIWVFHGALDQTVPIARSQEMVDALKAVGADVRFSIYPKEKHEVWPWAYNNPELYTWFLQHTRKR